MPNSIGILEPYEKEVEKLLDASVAPNTRTVYQKGIDLFMQFRGLYNLQDIWPPSVDQIINFIAFLSSKSISYSTAKTYLAGISFSLKLSNLPDPCQFFIVKNYYSVLSNSNIKKIRTRSPITFPLLKKIVASLQHVCSNYYEQILFSTAYTLAYFALLRVGEITSTRGNSCNSALSAQRIHMNVMHHHYIR